MARTAAYFILALCLASATIAAARPMPLGTSVWGKARQLLGQKAAQHSPWGNDYGTSQATMSTQSAIMMAADSYDGGNTAWVTNGAAQRLRSASYGNGYGNYFGGRH